jgi:hypothetical protein
MSLSKRRIEIDPETPVRELTDLLLNESEYSIEIRVGTHLFVVHRGGDEGYDPASSDGGEKRDATDRLLAAAGGWKGLVDGEALKSYLAENREIDVKMRRSPVEFA